MDYYAEKFKHPFRMWIGPTMFVYIADAENAEIVLKSKHCLNKPRFFRKIFIETLQVDGLFTLDGLKIFSDINCQVLTIFI